MRTAYKGMKQLWVLLLTMLLVCCMAFGAIAEEGATQTSGTNDLDGSKIEGVKVIWVTQDSATTAEGTTTPQEELADEAHLYLSSVSNGEVEMVYRIEAEFSGQYDYAPGDITITIPAQVWHGRTYEETGVDGETVGVVDENRLLGYLELPIPAAPSKKADFNWQIIDGNYVLTNTRTIGATSSVSIEVGIRGIRPVDVVDMSETDPITAHVEVVTNQGNTIELTSTPIYAQLDTQAQITSAYKDGEVFEDYPGLDEKLLANLPEDANPEDYIYVRWYTYHSHNNNQPYSLDIADVLSDAYEKVSDGNGGTTKKKVTNGIFLGSTNYEGQVLTNGNIDFTAEIGDHFNSTTTGTQYANTVYMWSAYKKSDFYVPNANEPPRVYYFENEVTWTLTETDKTVADAGNDKGKDPQKVTKKTDEVILPYAPVKWQRPRGAFAVNKWTERIGYKDWLYGYALNLLESREEVDMDFIVETVGYGYPWTSKLTQGYSYDELNNTVVNGELDKLELDASQFGKLGWKQVTDDFQTFFNFETEPLTSEDFEFKSLRVSVPGKMRYAKKSNGTWDYVTDSKLPTPDLVIEYQLNGDGEWHHAATATWGEDGLGQFAFVDVAAGVTTSGMTVSFPENVTDVRHTFVSNVFGGKTAEHCDIAMLDWYVYPTITMKSSDRVYGIVQELFEQSENPSTKFRNDVIMDAYGWVGEDREGTLVLDDDFDYSMATYEGASYGVALNKTATSESDAENQRLVIHYTATLTEQSNLKERSDYDAAVEAGVIPAETSGIWYDLLPPHVVPLLNTIKLRSGDTITNVYTEENYKDTGRTLLVVEAELTPVPTYANSIGYADRPRLEFDAAYTWMDMEEYGSELVNYVAFESTVEDLRNDTLGTIKNQKGDPDTPAGGNNANTPAMPEDIIKALTDLDPNTDENRFVYGKYSHMVSSLTYAVSGLQKAVKNDLVGIWTQGLDGQEQVTVYEGHYYTYSLRVSSAENTATKGIVIYDTIENYILPDPTADKDTDATKAADFAHTQARQDWTGDWQDKGQWRGTLTQVDLTEFVNAGVKPVLLYSTIPNLQFADTKSESTDGNFDEDTALLSSGSYDITDREIWQVAELDEKGVWQVPEGLAVTAVAIDATTTAKGEEFVLKPEEALAGYLKMRAPDDDGSEDEWNAKGAYARLVDENGEYILDENGNQQIDWEAAMNKENNMYAYNNARVRLIQGQAKEGNTTWLSNYRMIRNDYTRVGIVPEIITVEKAWQDQNDHDAMRPESVTINVLRRLAGTAGAAQPVLDADGKPLTAVLDESNGWKAEFKQVDIVNEDGVRYLYTFEEEPVEGYTSKVQFIDVNHYTMTNVHPNEQVEVSGVKMWDDDNDALGFRPETVTLKLYRDGEHIDTRTVKANGAGEWVYTFGKLDKYAEGGIPYKYEVKEEYVPKYVGESEGYELVNNTFVPVGSLEVSKTLVGATNAAKEQAFTFTLVLLAEKTDPNAPAVPLMDKYAYTIYTLEGEDWVAGETGEIGNSGTFTLKDNQKIVVEDLPSEATYEVIESEAAGFTSTATDATGAIRAGQTVQAAFVNEYKASGNVQLNVGKSLTGHAIRKNQFRFELVDNNPDSATYGEVIRTARVEAPEADATTGGSGEAIESLTQAIFGQLEYTQADDGQTYHYQVREVDTGKPGYTADEKVYDVAVSVADNGDGTMTVTPTWGDDPSMLFENTYKAEGELTLKAWKTLEGRELKDGEFTFELWSFDPETEETIGTEPLDTATNDAEGNVVFDALKFDQNSVSLDETNPATYTYLIREKQGTDKTVAYSNQEYVMTVTVFDNGDGTLSFAQGSQGYEREYVDCSKCAGTGAEYVSVYRPSYNLVHYTSLSGTSTTLKSGENFKLADLKEHLCKECGGFAAGNANACGHCHGIGLEVTYLENGEYEKSVGKGWILANTDHTDHYNISKITLCTLCEGTKIEPGKMTITGEATMPVFANTLKPGDLTVTKLVEGEGSSNSDQTFNFTIKLTGEVPEELDYGMTAPIPTPTPTPEPTATAAPAGRKEPVVKDARPPEIAPTVQPVVNDKEYYHASETELAGVAYVALNLNEGHEDYGKLIFFRSDETNPTDPWDNSFTPPTKRTMDEAKNIVYYPLYENKSSAVGEYDNRPWYGDRATITAIVVQDPIKPLDGTRLFYYLNNAKTAELSLLDTSGMTNMQEMFRYCTSLTSLKLNTFDTSNAKNMRMMFFDCSSLLDIDIRSFDTSKVTNMAAMFCYCRKLPKLDLSSFNTSKVTTMARMFESCESLTNLDLDTFNTQKVTDMSEMFREFGCESLDLKTFDTQNVTNMSRMFYEYSNLKEVNLRSFNTRKVTNMAAMFYGCTALQSLDLSNFATDSLTTFTYSGYYQHVYEGMFGKCSSLKTLDLTTFDTSKITRFSSLFKSCTNLEEVDLSSFDTSQNTEICEMFYACRNLKSLDLSTFDTSKLTCMMGAFQGCSSLTTLDLSTFDTSNVTNLNSTFRGCNSLVLLDLSSFDTGSVTGMYNTFDSCSKLSTVSIGAATVLKLYPTGSTTLPYDGRWVNVADEDKILTGADLFTTGGKAGTWTWYVTHYTLNFAPGEGGAGAMPSVKVTCGEAYSFVPLFYQFGYDLVGFSDDGTTTVKYPVSGGLVTIPSDSGYEDGETVTLTAVWEKRDVTVSESGDSVTFALKAGETFTLSDLPASLAYEVWEELPTGWVLVEKKDDTGVIQPLETSEAVFTNKYEPTQAQATLRASKTLDGKAPAGKFSFTLSEGGQVLQTVTNNGSGVVFDAITYDKAGTHSYTIAEVKGNDTTINYDANTYTVTVVVTDDGEGNLSAKVTYNTTDGQPPVFKNTTKPGGLSITKAVTGTLTDKAEEQAFTFEISLTDELMQPWSGALTMGEESLTVTDGKATVTIKGGESVTLTDIPAGLKYEVKETGELPGWTMDGTVKAGEIASTETKALTFTNGYSLSGYASIEAEKVLVGRDLTAGEFAFQLVGEDNQVKATTTNGADGRVLFPQMEYTDEGTWKYVIVEVKPSEDKIDDTVEYSQQRINVTVTAVDEKGDGKLTVTVVYDPDKTPITNTLKPGALEISKTLVSSNEAHKEKKFTFTVTLTDAAGAALNGDYTLNGTESLTVKDGTATLTIKGGETAIISGLPAGAKYSVTEAAEAGFTTEMTGESGTIAPNETAKAAFTNTYAAQGQYDFTVTKTLTGREMAEGEFQFVLMDEKGNELDTATNAADGTVTFKTLTFTDSDVGTKSYRITESDLKAAGMTYDKTVQEIVLTITDNGDGTLTVNDGLDGKAVEFQNTYNDKTSVSVEKTWQDEDDKLGVRPASVTVELYQNGKKLDEVVLNDENAWKHTFSDLAAFDANGVTYTYTVKELPVVGYDGMQSVKDGVNVFTNTVQGVLDVSKTVVAGTDADKAFAFTVTLTKAGEALTTEIILEKADVHKAVKPDSEGKVRFTLKDGETARLIGLPIGTEYKVEEAPEDGYTTTAENAEGLIQRYENHAAAFTNTYEAKGDVTFKGAKTLTGRDLAAEEFRFQLLDKNGTVLETVTNDADGKIKFTTLEYIHNKDTDVLGDHTYTVKEVIPAEADKLGGVTYNPTAMEYTVTVNVSDNGDGTLNVVASANAKALNFVNTYEAKGGVTFEGLKTLEGRELTENDIFEFEVTENDEVVATGKSDSDGKIIFTEITYVHNKDTKVLGEHTYTVKEVIPAETDKLGGVTYDEKEYTIKVTVTDNGDGTLAVTKQDGSDDYTKLDFVNSYTATGEITFAGTKSIDSRELTANDVFTFEILDATGKSFKPALTATNDEKGKIAYPTINYTLADVGTHTYTVKETSKNGKGITVATNTYTVTVDVSDNGDGTLNVVASTNAKALNFVNTYEAKGSVTFEGLKTLEGRELTENDIFEFEVTENDEVVATGKSDSDGKIIFTEITYVHNKDTKVLGEHTYTVKEVIPADADKLGGVTYNPAEKEYTVKVNVSDNGDGTLNVVASDNHKALDFVNTYKATGSITFEGTKTIDGRKMTDKDIFEFTITEQLDEGDKVWTVQNDATGKIVYPKIEYTLADVGTHTYTVKETSTDGKGITVATNTYTVTVEVSDNGDGTLNVEPSENYTALDFVNTYEATGDITFEGTKTIDGRKLTDEDIFSFSITEQVAEGETGFTGTAMNDADGTIVYPTINYTLDDVGTHTYTVKETSKDGKGIIVDANTYTVTVTVTDNGDGTLKVEASDNAKALNFVNTYEAKGSVTFEGTKTLTGRTLKAGEFSFILLDKDGKEIETVKNDADGKITFTALNYIHNKDVSDLGDHTYTVKEVQGNLEGVTYDAKQYTVTVTVNDNGDGTLNVVASDNHKALNFKNLYEADGTVLFTGTKVLAGREFRSGDVFLFELVENGVVVQRSRLTPAEGTEAAFTFNPIEYTTEDIGTHTYLIREAKGSIKGVTYDAAEYTVTVTVADAGNGKLSISKAITVNGEAADEILFTNIYEATGEMTLTAEKTVNGETPTADQVFSFTLSDEDGEIETVQNKLGEINFAKLSYTLADLGEHTYTVKENATEADGYTIDTTVYTVKVNVTDNGDGTLKVAKDITANGKSAERMTFDNKHSANLTISKTVEGCTTDETFPVTVWLFDAKGNELQGEYAYTGDVKGNLTSGQAIQLGHGQSVTIELPVGTRYKVEETKDPRFATKVNTLQMNTAEGEIIEGGNMAAFVNELITTEFTVWKEWRGGEGGKIRLTLYANGEKLDPQPEYTNNGNMYKYTELPKFDEDGDEIIYTAKEKYMDGYLTIYNNVSPYETVTDVIHNGGTIINKAVMDFKVQKVWSGLADNEEKPAIALTLYCNGEVYMTETPTPDKDGWYHYRELPVFVNGERAVYSVLEEPLEGCSTTYTNGGEEGDCAYDGGTITNTLIPKTGDDAPVALWLTTMLASAAAMMLLVARRRKA